MSSLLESNTTSLQSLLDEVNNLPNAGSGGGSVQSDWNQTDDTAADFIKNKPFGDYPVVILEEQELQYDPEIEACIAEVTTPIQEGHLSLIVDGESYECDTTHISIYLVFGNLGLLGMGEDTGEPFIGMYAAGMVLMVFTDSQNHTVRISGYSTNKLDIKYTTVQTVFYRKDGDNYLYIDPECTIKATTADVLNAGKFGLIAVHMYMSGILGQAEIAAFLQYTGDYAYVATYISGKLYSAEYTE